MGGNTLKTTDTLVDDIYRVVSTKEVPEGVDLDKAIDSFGENVKRLMHNLFSENKKRDNRTLRMSNIGRDDRYLWNLVNNSGITEELLPHVHVKFMYGHLIEEMLVFLTRAAGHEVTDEQKVCEVNGIVGHMDCKIDGVVTDIKSASTFGFKKFKDGTLAQDDPFGYVGQIKGYAHAEGETTFGWLAMDKQNGHLTYLKYDTEDKGHPAYEHINWNVEEHIDRLKKIVELPEPPKHCEEPVEDGKSGNLKLSTKCSYCPYKTVCHTDIRTFIYSSGPRYLTKVVKEPNVPELGGKHEEGF